MSTEHEEIHSDNEGYESCDSREYFSDEDKYLEYKERIELEKKEKMDLDSMDNLYDIYRELIDWSENNGFSFFNTSGFCTFQVQEFLKFFFDNK